MVKKEQENRFSLKTAEEIAKLDNDGLIGYLGGYTAHLNTEVTDLRAKFDAKEIELAEYNLRAVELNTTQQKEVSAVAIAVKKIGEHLAKRTAGAGDTKPTSIRDRLKQSFKDSKEKLEGVADQKSGFVEFKVKAAVNMTYTDSTIDDGGGLIPQAARVTPYVSENLPTPFVRDFVTILPLPSTEDGRPRAITWVEQTELWNGADVVDEAGLKPKSSWKWAARVSNAIKIAHHVIISDEMLRFSPQLTAETNRLMREFVELKEDQQLYAGTGVGELEGISTIATAYDPTPFALSIPNANRLDVLLTAIDQVANATTPITGVDVKAGYTPSVVFISVTDATFMKLDKGTDGHYTLPNHNSMNGMNVSGIRVFATVRVLVGGFIVCDPRYSSLYDTMDYTIKTGYIDKQLIENMATIVAEKEMIFITPENRFGAYVKGDFESAITAINKP